MRKSTIAVITSVLILALALTACGAKDSANDTPAGSGAALPTQEAGKAIDNLKTMSDVFAYESLGEHWLNGVYIYVFEMDGTYYRASAKLSKKELAELDKTDIVADDFNEKRDEIVGPVPITKLENLSTYILKEEDLEQFKGKSGQDLLDAGFELVGYSADGKEINFMIVGGLFCYTANSTGSEMDIPKDKLESVFKKSIINYVEYLEPDVLSDTEKNPDFLK